METITRYIRQAGDTYAGIGIIGKLSLILSILQILAYSIVVGMVQVLKTPNTLAISTVLYPFMVYLLFASLNSLCMLYIFVSDIRHKRVTTIVYILGFAVFCLGAFRPFLF